MCVVENFIHRGLRSSLEVNGLAAAEIETSLHQYSTSFQESRESQGIKARHSEPVKEALNKSPLARRWVCGTGCAKGDDANGATAQGGAASSERKMRSRSGLLAPHVYFSSVWHPRRCPIPASRGPSGHAPGSHGVCAPWHRSPSSTCVARLMIIPILPATRSARICSALP